MMIICCQYKTPHTTPHSRAEHSALPPPLSYLPHLILCYHILLLSYPILSYPLLLLSFLILNYFIYQTLSYPTLPTSPSNLPLISTYNLSILYHITDGAKDRFF